MRDIIAIGTSSGGLEALRHVVSGLPPNFPASVFVVQHVLATVVSRLPELLSLSGPLPAVHATDGAVIEPGYIYVAPPDRHLRIGPGHMHVTTGPKENFARPSINPLLRSA